MNNHETISGHARPTKLVPACVSLLLTALMVPTVVGIHTFNDGIISFEETLTIGPLLHTPASCVEADRYALANGKWNSFPVTYQIDVTDAPADVQAGAAAAVEAGFEAWEGHVASIPNFFQRVDSSLNKVRFAYIDGPGGSFATAKWAAKNRIMTNFTMTFDTADDWEIYTTADQCPTPDGLTGHDLQNAATHEAGHIVGLAHVSQVSKNQALTMYPFKTGQGETLKRSPGIGDVHGMQTQYS